MDLVERYLAAVDAQLPPASRADVIAELRDTLLSKLEALEVERGQSVEQGDIEAMLRAFGHPLVVANRYRAHRELIGPEVYPFYVVTLQAVFGLVLFVHIVGAALSAAGAFAISSMLDRLWDSLVPGFLTAFAIVTIVFIVIDRAGGGPGLARAWSPRGLADRSTNRPSRIWETLFEMAFESVFLLWWIGLIRFPSGPVMGFEIIPAEIWTTLHTPILLVVAGGLALNLLKLVRGGWLWPIAGFHAVVSFGALVVIVLLFRAETLFAFTSEEIGPTGVAGVHAWVNGIFKVGLAGAGLIATGEVVGDIMRAARGSAMSRSR
jgi:hypothetical protein